MSNKQEMENLVIRNMQEGDIEAVARISEEGFDEYYKFDYKKSAQLMWLNTVQQGQVNIFIAENEDEVAGYITLKPWLDGGWIDLIAVEKKSRRTGLARKMVEHLAEKARIKGMRFLSCIIHSELLSVKSFWESCGFRVVGQMEKLLSETHDGLLFYKYIEKA